MEYTELADYPIPSGTVTEWLPSAPTTAWHSDDRHLSTNHRAHLDSTRRTSPATRTESWIGTAFRLAPTLDDVAFDTTIRAWVARHEAFRTTVITDAETGGHRRQIIGSDDVSIDIRRYGRTRSSDEIYHHLDDFFATEVTAERWPHLVFTTVEATDGVIVILAADHSVMDAYTQLLAICELVELYRAAIDNRAPQLPPCGSYVDYSAAEHAAAQAISLDHPATREWRSFLETAPGEMSMPTFPLPVSAPSAEKTGAQSSLSLWLLTDEESDAFGAACKQHGGSLSGGALTALSIALARLTTSRVARYVMPKHTRTSAEWFTAAGWFVGLAPVEADLGGAESFGAAIGQIGASARSTQHLVGHSFPRVADLLGITEPPAFVVSFIDGRHLPGADAWTPQDRALRSRTHCGDEVYLWINRTRQGMNISLRFPNNETAAHSVHSFIAEFGAVLREVATTGDAAIFADAPIHDTGVRDTAVRDTADNR